MTHNTIHDEVRKWLKRQKYDGKYVGGTDDLRDVCLDGWFNLEDLAEHILAKMIDEVETEIHKELHLIRTKAGKNQLKLVSEITHAIRKVFNKNHVKEI